MVRERRPSPPARAGPVPPTSGFDESTAWGFAWVIGGIFVVALLLVGAIVFVVTQSGDDSGGEATVTTQATTSAGAPSNVQAAPENTIATITWDDASNGEATQFVVVPIDENNKRLTPQVVDGVTHATVTGLDPNLGYCFVVVAEIGSTRAVDDSLSHACIRGAQLQS